MLLYCLMFQAAELERPDLSLFLVKYLMTLVVGISAVFWVSSKKTCSEWAYFFNRTRKKEWDPVALALWVLRLSVIVIPCSLTHSPISESRRVLQESCEFFLKHNSRVRHKKKHYSPSSHKLKVISKSMGTSTGAVPLNATAASTLTNHGTPAVGNHDAQAQCSLSEASVREHLDRCTSSRSSRRGVRDKEREGGGRQSKGGSSSKVSSRSESTHRVPDVRYVRCLFHYPAASRLYRLSKNLFAVLDGLGWLQRVSWSPAESSIQL